MATGGARRLTLSPIGFDIVLALSQAEAGLRLADIAHVIGSPVSSVQTALRILVANELVRREALEPPRYRLSPEHPARDELVSLATVLPDAAHSIGIVLRANPAVTFAAVDALGFIAVHRQEPADSGALAALDDKLAAVADARPDTPTVMRMSEVEIERLTRVAVGLGDRVGRALPLKGRAPARRRELGEESRRRRAAR